MLSDITIGQYFPGNSILHRLDPRMKIIITFLYVILLFTVSSFLGFAVAVLFLAVMIAMSKISVKVILKGVKPIIPLIIITSLLNLFFVVGDSEPLVKFWIFQITYDGIELAIRMIVRIISLIMGTSLLTYTTSPIALTDAIENLLSPLKKIKMPVHELAMMMTIALRFIPTLIQETDKIMSAQKARGADMETGNLMQRAKALVPILIPLFISAFRRAEELALAMECRCYQGGNGRTRMRQLRYGKNDFIALFVVVAVFVLGVLL